MVPSSRVPSPISTSLTVLGRRILDQSSTKAWPCIRWTLPKSASSRPTKARIHHQPGASQFDRLHRLTLLAAACNAAPAQRCRRTDHGPQLSSKWVSTPPSHAFIPPAIALSVLSSPASAPRIPLHLPLSSPARCSRLVYPSSSWPGLPVLCSLARVAAGAPGSPVLSLVLHPSGCLVPTGRKRPFHPHPHNLVSRARRGLQAPLNHLSKC